MAARKTIAEFTETYLHNLGSGEEAFQGTLFPGMYPNTEDRQSLNLIVQGQLPDLNTPYQDTIHTIRSSGAILRRLRVLPGPDQRDHHLLDTIKTFTTLRAVAGEDARVIGFEEFKAGLLQTCGNTNRLVRQYLEGAQTHNPQASFWSIRKRMGDGALTLAYVGISDYEQGRALGHEPFVHPEIPGHVQAYEACIRGMYFNNAHPVGPELYPEVP